LHYYLFARSQERRFRAAQIYSLDRLARNENGDVLAAITTDEKDPASVFPFPGSTRWHYGGFPVTQYWKKPRGTFRDDLHVAVNARFSYWKNHRPIPGGVFFENSRCAKNSMTASNLFLALRARHRRDWELVRSSL
jgi:hypothetical protein